jgi:hypothetical protein
MEHIFKVDGSVLEYNSMFVSKENFIYLAGRQVTIAKTHVIKSYFTDLYGFGHIDEDTLSFSNFKNNF